MAFRKKRRRANEYNYSARNETQKLQETTFVKFVTKAIAQHGKCCMPGIEGKEIQTRHKTAGINGPATKITLTM